MHTRLSGMQAPSKKLTTLRLAAATYFLVAGGPYGLEELVQSSGYALAAVMIVLTPIVFSLPTALMVGELASSIPEEGGYYAWVKRALGPFWGFVEAWLSLCASFFDMAIYPTLFVTYLGRLLPGADAGMARLGLGLGMIVLCTAWNLRGARSVGNASVAMAIVLLGPFFVLAAVATGGAAEPAPQASPGALGAGLLVAMWNFMGWDNASTFAGEVDRPQRTYPRAMVVAVLAVAVTYLLPVLAAAQTGVPTSVWSTGTWVLVAGKVGGPWLARAVAFGGVVCGVGMYNALLMSYSRIPAVLAEDGLLPAAFAKTNARGVPMLSVAVCSVLYSVGLLLSFRKLVELDLLFYGIALVLEFVSLAVLRVREPSLERPFRVPGGKVVAVLLGMPTAALFSIALYKELSDGASHSGTYVVGALSLVAGAIAWRLRKRSAVKTA